MFKLIRSMEPDKPQPVQTTPEKTQGGYGKKPMWQWIAIYAVIGVVVYGLVYYLFIAKKQTKPYNTTTQVTNSTQTSPTTKPMTNPANQIDQEEVKVTLTKSGFSPKTLTISQGAKVIWTNESGAKATVNSDDHPSHKKFPFLNLGSFDNGQTLEVVFDSPGTYTYHNHLNSSQTGTVVVE